MSDTSTRLSKFNPLIWALCDALKMSAISEHQFQREAAMLRAICRAHSDLIIQLCADGTILNVNTSPDNNLVHKTHEALHRNINEFVTSESAQTLHIAMENALRNQQPTTHRWQQVVEEEERHFEVRVSYLDSNEVLVIVSDITAQHHLGEQLQEVPRRLLTAQEDERRRLSGDLHDELGQDLTAILLQVHQAQVGAAEESHTNLAAVADALQALTRKVRRLAQELHPVTLDELGLSDTLHSLCRSVAQRADLHIDLVNLEGHPRFLPEIEHTVYRIVQEALTNIVRHAQARQVTIDLYQRDQRLFIRITDDGQGFDAARAESQSTYGLRNLREQVRLLDGRLDLDTAPGRGTHLTIDLPATPVLKG